MAYGHSAGSRPNNFNGGIEFKGLPEHARKIALEHSHLMMNWYHGRDLKLAVQWTREGNEPSAEVLLVVEARRGKSEDSAHKGRYALTVTVPSSLGGDGKPKKASGRATCTSG